MKTIQIILISLCISLMSLPKLTAADNTVKGLVTDALTGESLPGATILVQPGHNGVSTDENGSFELLLPPGQYHFYITYVGYEHKSFSLDHPADSILHIDLQPHETILSEVVVLDRRIGEQVQNTEMGVVRMQAKAIAQIPAMMGEVDVIRAIQMLPGVQSAGEGSTGFSIRGGGIDQNLVLLDEANVYNASHLMGFFSVFNNDVVKDINLYKGNVPAEYGGRLSSLLNITVREGDKHKFGGSGGIGTISSRLMLEGPLVKDRISIIAAGRRSYADLFLPLAANTGLHNNKLFFYDANIKLSAAIDERNRLLFSSYHGKDVFRLGNEDPFTMDWGNTTYSFRWSSILNKEWLLNVNLLFTGYDYSLMQESSAGDDFLWEAGNRDMGVKADFSWYPSLDHTVKFGFSSFLHVFNPGVFRGLGDDSMFDSSASTGSNALSHAVFVSSEQSFGNRWSAEYGMRASAFQNMGSATVYRFDDDFAYIDSVVYGSGEIYNTWAGLEPRLGIRYSINQNNSLKASYSRSMQYLHLASYSDGGNPLDIWVPSSAMIKPQMANQYAIGYFRNLPVSNQIIESSVEVYYKDMDNQIDFRDNAWLMLNPKIEGEFRFGRAWAYGAEFLIRKNEGSLTGWLSYTWSKTERQIDGINDGNVYPASYDRTHNLSLVTNYTLSPRVSVSATWVFSSGKPVTMPSGRFEYGNEISPVYTERNGYRMPAYHRLDLGATIKTKQRADRNFRGEWNISLYNAYYRKNTWMIDFRPDNEHPGKIDAYNVYLFPIIPSVTYNIYF